MEDSSYANWFIVQARTLEPEHHQEILTDVLHCQNLKHDATGVFSPSAFFRSPVEYHVWSSTESDGMEQEGVSSARTPDRKV